jgi:hypothetical protein
MERALNVTHYSEMERSNVKVLPPKQTQHGGHYFPVQYKGASGWEQLCAQTCRGRTPMGLNTLRDEKTGKITGHKVAMSFGNVDVSAAQKNCKNAFEAIEREICEQMVPHSEAVFFESMTGEQIFKKMTHTIDWSQTKKKTSLQKKEPLMSNDLYLSGRLNLTADEQAYNVQILGKDGEPIKGLDTFQKQQDLVPAGCEVVFAMVLRSVMVAPAGPMMNWYVVQVMPLSPAVKKANSGIRNVDGELDDAMSSAAEAPVASTATNDNGKRARDDAEGTDGTDASESKRQVVTGNADDDVYNDLD